MKIFRTKSEFAILVFIFFASVFKTVGLEPKELPWRILYLNSYNPGYNWTDEVSKGIHNYFVNRDTFAIFTEYLDSKQFQITDIENYFKPYLKAKFKNFKFDIIITSDNDALNFVVNNRDDDLFKNIPVVFCGITNIYDYPIEKEDLYGVEETDIFKQSFDKFRKLVPDFRTVYYLSDRTITSRVYEKIATEVIAHYPSYNIIKIDSISLTNFDSIVSNLKGDAIIYYSGINRDGLNQFVDHLNIADRIIENAQIPVFSYITNKNGLTGGVYERGFQHGNKCAELAEMRLKGIPISKRVYELELTYFFDYMQLQRYNLSLLNLPKNSIVINKPESIFKKHRIFIMFNGVILLTLIIVIVMLFWYNRLRKRSEELMKNKMETALESDRLKSAFLANMSHEIRTPMNAIIGFSTLIADEALTNEKRSRYSLIIKDRAFELIRFFDDLLDVSRLEVGQMSLIINEINLNEFLNNIYDYYIIKMSNDPIKSKLYFRLTISEELEGCRILIDKHRLKQVLTNLIENALKFTNSGGIEVFCQKLSDTEIQFIVRDTGIGIPKDKYEIVFQHFKQAHNQLSTKLGGTGLGLTISKGIIKLMKGEIWLESEIGKGTSFIFNIPLRVKELTTESNFKK